LFRTATPRIEVGVKHFSEQVWADFVRGVQPSKAHGEVDAHIASGCSDCVAAVGLWQKVRSIGINEPCLTPPDDIVRMAKLELAARKAPHATPWTLARLVFDSFSQPLTAGVRAGGSDSRQLMFDAAGTMVDLVLDHQPQSGTILLVGQVVDKAGARIAPRQVAVIVWTETGQPLAETSANQFGEFQMEFAPQSRLRLSVEIVGCNPVRIPPIDLTPDSAHPVT
jgi:hypothetical protein